MLILTVGVMTGGHLKQDRDNFGKTVNTRPLDK